MDSSLLCSICSEPLETDPTTIVREKGLQTLIKKSEERNDDKWKQWIGKTDYIFHMHCRKRYAASSSNPARRSESIVLSTPDQLDCSSQSNEFLVPPSPSFTDLSASSLQFSSSFAESENNFEFLSIFIKIENIAHSIISTLQPKSFISCLQLSVGTYIYRKTGSKLVINLLNKLGVSSSYYNIQLHEASTIIHPQTTTIEDAFVQYVFDNTDHNANTLNGRETFHCLGGIAVYTPGSNVVYEGTTQKCKKMPNAITLSSQNVIPDVTYDAKCASGLDGIQYEKTNQLKLGIKPILSPTYATFLWGKCFKIGALPMWRGFMETLSSKNKDYVVSHVKCLPFINRPPPQYPMLNTALHYAASESRHLKQTTTFVTFDQPLYLKARNIVAQYEEKELKNVVVRLGGFHLLMSYLGAIGSIMAKLEATMEVQEYENFTKEGFFTVRRSHKAWAGIWSDMTIEQTLNRFFGTDLKHGRGVTPSVVARYLSTMPSAFNMMTNLEEYCNITTSSSEQHVDLSPGRMKRDELDLDKFIFWLNEHEPFKPRIQEDDVEEVYHDHDWDEDVEYTNVRDSEEIMEIDIQN